MIPSCSWAVCQLSQLGTWDEHSLKIILALRYYVGNNEGDPLIRGNEVLFPEVFKKGLSLYTTSRKAPGIPTCLLYPCDYCTLLPPSQSQNVTSRDRAVTEAALPSERVARLREISDVCAAYRVCSHFPSLIFHCSPAYRVVLRLGLSM